jgi:hypothetical protein
VVSTQGRLGHQLPNISLGATSMHIHPTGMTFNPEEWIMDNDLISLNDGSRTRINRATKGESAPDVTLVHYSLVTGATWKQLLI